MRRETATIAQMLHAVRLVDELLEGFDQTTFRSDERTWSAVLYQLAVIGEASRRLSSEFRTSHAHVNWSGMVGLRNVIIHNYDTLDSALIWQVVKVELPQLESQLGEILAQLMQSGDSEQTQERP